jgi:multidrug efflux pump subunit AcrA (membrane-fusion protein)
MQSHTKRRLTIVSLVAVAVIAVAVALAGPSLGSQDEAAVATTTVTRGDLEATVTGSGNLVDRYTYSVAPGTDASLIELAGQSQGSAASGMGFTTQRVYVKTGQHVSFKQRLALVENSTGSRETVKAPVAGYVRSITTSKGASTGQVATIGSGGQFAAVAVSEYDVGQIKAGQTVSVRLSATDTTLEGKVVSVSETADDTTGVEQYQVLISARGLPGTARIGMSVTAEITTDSAQNVLLAPATAITETGDRSTAQVLQADGATRVVTVEIGLVGASQVEVVSGLQEGDEVVTGVDGTVSTSSTGGFPGGGAPGGGA